MLTAIESHEYHMKIVPTIYEDLSGNNANSFQYTFAHKSHIAFSHHGMPIPAIWFRYVSHYNTNMCLIFQFDFEIKSSKQ